MITQDEAIEMAYQVGAWIQGEGTNFDCPEKLTAFANAVRKQTLLEAAVEFDKDAGCHGMDSVQTVAAVNLRQMAGVE